MLESEKKRNKKIQFESYHVKDYIPLSLWSKLRKYDFIIYKRRNFNQ